MGIDIDRDSLGSDVNDVASIIREFLTKHPSVVKGIDHYYKKKGGLNAFLTELALMVVTAMEKPSTLEDDESGWAEVFNNGIVMVRDPETARALVKAGMDDVETAKVVLGELASKGALAIPIRKYPGVALPF